MVVGGVVVFVVVVGGAVVAAAVVLVVVEEEAAFDTETGRIDAFKVNGHDTINGEIVTTMSLGMVALSKLSGNGAMPSSRLR